MASRQPFVGAIFEYRRPAGKRIRIEQIEPVANVQHGRPERRAYTVVVAHPASPQQVGYRSTIRLDRLFESNFTLIDTEETR